MSLHGTATSRQVTDEMPEGRGNAIETVRLIAKGEKTGVAAGQAPQRSGPDQVIQLRNE